MANPTVTYTFVNGNVADASQVNQNFTDLINSLTDGTKSLNIDAITAAGAATFNGNTTIGNASGDTSTVNATMSFATTPQVDVIAEKTSGAGVTIDGVKLKDSGIVGKADGAAVAAGYVGQVISSTLLVANRTDLTTNTWKTVTSITLTPGSWEIKAMIGFSGNGSAVTGTKLAGGIGTADGDGATGLVLGSNLAFSPTMPTAATEITLAVPSDSPKDISTNTVYYLKAFGLFTVGTLQAFGKITATRVA